MSPRQLVAGLLTFSTLISGPASMLRADAQPATPEAPLASPDAEGTAEAAEVTPPRVSYLHGEVSFWRPGAEDWTPAKLNTPVAPGDVFYTGAAGNVELQVGPRAFVRAAENTQLGFDNQEPDFLQFHVTGGHAAVDLREMPAGYALELGTPNAVFTVERAGYYRLDVARDSTTFRAHRGGGATMTPAGGAATPIAANQQVVVSGTDSPSVTTGAAPELTAWDRWNYQRTAYVLRPVNTTHVPAGVYGAEELDQHGSWRTVDTYGSVWVPSSVPAGWVPYSTGRWIWDARYGWTWLDDAPWGWAPYHYGRWVFVRNYWAWAPGPVIVRPVYSPALVVFLGGGVRVGIGVRPVFWAPLAWGEPLIPWWGRPGFVGVVTWRGWGGPRVVNNVVVSRTTVVNVTNVNVYRNVTVNKAVVGVSSDRFGHRDRPRRIADAEMRELSPVRGALDVKPVAASVTVAEGRAARPPAELRSRAAVATRLPHDAASTLRSQGIAATQPAESPAAPRIVPSPRRERESERASIRPNDGPWRGPEQRREDGARQGRDERQDRGDRPERRERGGRPDRGQQQAAPAPPSSPGQPQPSVVPAPPGRGDRPDRSDRQERGERRERQQQAAPAPPSSPGQPQPSVVPAPPGRGDRPDRNDRQERGERRERQQQAAPTPPSAPAQPQPSVVPSPPSRSDRPNRNDRQERGEPRERSQPVTPAPPQQQAAPTAVPQPQAAPSRPAPQAPAPPPRHAAPSAPPRIERPEGGERGERRERGSQQAAPIPQRQSAPSQQAPPARPEPAPNRGDRPERSEQPERGSRSERVDRPERGDRQEREPQRRGDRQQRAERQERPDR